MGVVPQKPSTMRFIVASLLVSLTVIASVSSNQAGASSLRSENDGAELKPSNNQVLLNRNVRDAKKGNRKRKANKNKSPKKKSKRSKRKNRKTSKGKKNKTAKRRKNKTAKRRKNKTAKRRKNKKSRSQRRGERGRQTRTNLLRKRAKDP